MIRIIALLLCVLWAAPVFGDWSDNPYSDTDKAKMDALKKWDEDQAGAAVIHQNNLPDLDGVKINLGVESSTTLGDFGAATGSGMEVGFAILDGDDTYDFRVDPDGTDRIITTSADGDYLGADDAGDFIWLIDIADGYWLITDKQGTWTEE